MALRVSGRDVVDIRVGVPNGWFPFDFGLAMENRSRPTHDLSASESFQFAMIRQACQSNDPDSALTNLVIWFGMCHQVHAASSIERFTRNSVDRQLAEQIKVLREARISGSRDWSGGELLGAVIQARDKLIQRPTSCFHDE